MKRAILTVIAIIVILVLWIANRQHRLTTTFNEVALGTTKTDLLSQLGKPWKSDDCGKTFGGDHSPDCANELLYASPFAPVIPQYWAFRFNGRDRLIEKYRYVSP